MREETLNSCVFVGNSYFWNGGRVRGGGNDMARLNKITHLFPFHMFLQHLLCISKQHRFLSKSKRLALLGIYKRD